MASFLGAASLACSDESVPALIPRPLVEDVSKFAPGEAGWGSCSLGSSRAGFEFDLEGTVGAGDGTAGDRGC